MRFSFQSLAPVIVVLFQLLGAAFAQDWPEHGRDKAGTRYTPLRQITRDNVSDLEIAWTYDTGETRRRGAAAEKSTNQAIPILAGGHLIVCTPFNRIIALDPRNGREQWTFDPGIETVIGEKGSFKCRGVAAWRDELVPPTDLCHERILSGTNDLRLIAIDGRTGRRCPAFGTNGEVATAPGHPPAFTGEIAHHSAPAIVNGVIVLGSTIVDDYRADTPNGMVQAFDARTGTRLWTFSPVPEDPADPAMATWGEGSARRTGSANVWGHMAVDEARDLVFLPTSTPAPDSYGGGRPGNNVYANSVVALRGATGEIVWHFQIVHHSLWDYDLAAQPLLVDLPRNGTFVPALVQNTKQGMVFVFNRVTGEPLFPIEERPVPTGDIPGERYSPTQPFPVKPRPLIPQGASPDDAWGFVLWDKWVCRRQMQKLRHGPIYTPPSLQGTIISPWPGGGVNWGAAYDPERRWMIVNTNRMMKVVKLVPAAEREAKGDDDPDEFEYGPPRRLSGTPYAYQEGLLLSPLGAPCNRPPWGALSAVDLVSGEIKWEVPLGSIEEFLPVPIPWRLGTPNIGGPIVTGCGLVFIGATLDRKLRAFDVETGEQLWQSKLPAAALTTPVSYEAGGRQFIAVVAGGSADLPGERGDSIVAFALPR